MSWTFYDSNGFIKSASSVMSIPANMVTTDTVQTITAQKTIQPTIIEDVQAFTASGSISATGGRIVTYSGAPGETLGLPPATKGLAFDIYSIDPSDAVTIDGNGAETIDGNATAIVPAGGRIMLRCNVAGQWISWRTGTNASAAGSGTNLAGAVNPTFATLHSISVGPGSYIVTANGWFDVATAVANIRYYARLYNATTASVIIDSQDHQESATGWASPVFIQWPITVTTNTTIRFEAAVGAASGTQLIRNTSLIARSL